MPQDAQEPDWDALARLPLADWRPRAQLRAAETVVERAAVPARNRPARRSR